MLIRVISGLLLHIPQRPKFLHCGCGFFVLGAAGTLGDLGGLQLFDDLVDSVGFRFDSGTTGDATNTAEPLAVFGEVEIGDREVLPFYILPDIQLGPVQ